MSALPALTVENLERRSRDTRSGRIVRALCAVYPEQISARQLMIRAGLAYHSDPVSAFVELCNSFIRINQELPRHGWQAVRTGVTPDDLYRLSSPGG